MHSLPSDPDPAAFAQRLIAEDDLPEAFARWIGAKTGAPPPRFKKVEPRDEADEQD